MADTKGTAGKSAGMNVDMDLVRALAELLSDSGLTEIEVADDDRRIRVARNAGGMVMAAPALAAASVAAPVAAAAPADNANDNANAMKSPMVGTVYLAAEPGSANFVKIGDQVTEGQTVLIVEAMKVMNPIAADRAGTVQAILVENAQPIEYDQPLIVIA